ncbi:MAG: septation protein SpoVG family protein [Clostridia bacterium]|nr:septation protein SpoVG family protein [Clostridia bacterium]
MKITEIKIRKLFDENALKAIVSVTFDNCFTVHDIKVVYANSKYFTVMPNKKSKDGRISDVAHPINREFREILEEEIINHYTDYMEKTQINS